MIGVLHLVKVLAHPICHNHAILCLVRINDFGHQAVTCMFNLRKISTATLVYPATANSIGCPGPTDQLLALGNTSYVCPRHGMTVYI